MKRTELLLLMAGASFINYVGRLAFSISGPDIIREYGFSESDLGSMFSAFSAGYAIFMLPSGVAADRFGPARVLGYCGLATAALSAGVGLATTFAAFIALRFAFGIASAVLYPACGNLTQRWYLPERHSTVQGIVVGGGTLGAAATPLLMAYLGERFGWRVAFAVVGVLTAVFFAVWRLRVRDTADSSDALPAAAGGWRLLLRNGPMLLLAVQAFCIAVYYNFSDYWSFYYFREVRHFSNRDSAMFTAILQVLGAVMMPLGGWAFDWAAPWIGRRWLGFAALALAGVLLGAGAVAAAPLVVVALLSISFGLVVSTEGVYWWAVLGHGRESPGAAYGFANAAGNVGQFLAPLLFPRIAGWFGWTASVESAAVALLAAALLWALVPRPAYTPAQ